MASAVALVMVEEVEDFDVVVAVDEFAIELAS